MMVLPITPIKTSWATPHLGENYNDRQEILWQVPASINPDFHQS